MGHEVGEETRARMSDAARNREPRPHSDEVRARISASMTPTRRAIMSAKLTGIRRTPETRERMRQAALARHARDRGDMV